MSCTRRAERELVNSCYMHSNFLLAVYTLAVFVSKGIMPALEVPLY